MQVGNADVEAFVHVGVPHYPHISNEKCAQVTLQKHKSEIIELLHKLLHNYYTNDQIRLYGNETKM